MPVLFFFYPFIRFSRYFKTRILAKTIVMILFSLLVGLIALGIFLLFRRGLISFLEDPLGRTALPFYMYELFLLVISYLIVLGGFVSGSLGFFRRGHDIWIMESPRFGILPLTITQRVFFVSLWPLLVIAVPGLIAVHMVLGLGIVGFSLAILSIVLLVAFLIFSLLVFILAFTKFLFLFSRSSSSSFRMRGFGVVLMLVFAAISYIVWQSFTTIDVVAVLSSFDEETAALALQHVGAQFRIFPSHISATTLYALTQGETREALLGIGQLMGLTMIAALLLGYARRWHLALWQILQEGHLHAKTQLSKASTKATRFPRYFKGSLGALLEKEMLLITRSVRTMAWMGFLFFIWLLQTGANVVLVRTATRYNDVAEAAPAFIATFQLATLVFFISTFVLRFVFPAFSAERKEAWIIASAPLDFKRVFWVKLLFYTTILMGIAVLISLMNVFLLNISVGNLGFFFASVLFSTFYLVALGLGLGALFPNFETDDPEALSTSLPGLAFIALVAVYGGIGGFTFYTMLTAGSILPFFLFVGGALLFLAGLLFFVLRALRRFEFVHVLN